MQIKVPKAQALEVLARLLAEAGSFDDTNRRVRVHTDPRFALWRDRTRMHLRNIFGAESEQELAFLAINFEERPESGLVLLLANPFSDAVVRARHLLTIWHDFISEYEPDSVAPPSRTPSTRLDLAIFICDRLHHVATRLSERRDKRRAMSIRDEHDLQYLLGGLLALHFDDVQAEDVVPTTAGASSRIDFVLRRERIAIETKMTRESLRDKDIGDELIVDIRRYQSHPGVDALICLVHDPEHLIKNAAGLASDLEQSQGVSKIRVLVRG